MSTISFEAFVILMHISAGFASQFGIFSALKSPAKESSESLRGSLSPETYAASALGQWSVRRTFIWLRFSFR
jgi:hypothetical protein